MQTDCTQQFVCRTSSENVGVEKEPRQKRVEKNDKTKIHFCCHFFRPGYRPGGLSEKGPFFADCPPAARPTAAFGAGFLVNPCARRAPGAQLDEVERPLIFGLFFRYTAHWEGLYNGSRYKVRYRPAVLYNFGFKKTLFFL